MNHAGVNFTNHVTPPDTVGSTPLHHEKLSLMWTELACSSPVYYGLGEKNREMATVVSKKPKPQIKQTTFLNKIFIFLPILWCLLSALLTSSGGKKVIHWPRAKAVHWPKTTLRRSKLQTFTQFSLHGLSFFIKLTRLKRQLMTAAWRLPDGCLTAAWRLPDN